MSSFGLAARSLTGHRLSGSAEEDCSSPADKSLDAQPHQVGVGGNGIGAVPSAEGPPTTFFRPARSLKFRQ